MGQGEPPMKIFTTLALVAAVFVPAARAAAQTLDKLSVTIDAFIVFPNVGEQPRVGGGADPSEVGQTVRHGISQPSGRCYMSLSRTVEPNAAVGWEVQLTPIRVVDDAVTFRVMWARVRDEGKAASQAKGDVELTLRPGESVPIDTVPQKCTDPVKGPSLGTTIRASVKRWPYPDQDRRLMSVELWLVEKLQNGSERTQALSLRGLYHHPIPFYFDRIMEGQTALDFLGDVTIAPGGQTSDVTLVTRSRVFDSKIPLGYNDYPSKTTAKVQLRPDEVVSVELPKVGCMDPHRLGPCTPSAVFGSRVFSLRIRVRQIR
jgi:hypothetical protein